MSDRSQPELSDDRIRLHAERLVSAPVALRDLALAFRETAAATAEVLVAGTSFSPPVLEDIASAESSVHINQFGFRPGRIGDAFAEALIAKAAEGVPVSLVVDRQGSDPERGARDHYARLTAGGVEVAVVRATQARAPGAAARPRAGLRWNRSGLGHIDQRKAVVVDGRIGWVGGPGSRITSRMAASTTSSSASRARSSPSSSSSSSRASAGSAAGCPARSSTCRSRRSTAETIRCVRASCTTHQAPFRPITDQIARLFDDARETLDVVNP